MLLGKLIATAKSTAASTPPSPAKFTAAAGRANRFWRTLAAAFDALVTGSRTIPLGDNGMLIRQLGERQRAIQAWRERQAGTCDGSGF